MNKNVIPVVFSTDHNFIMPTGVSIQSMLECSTDVDCAIYILQANNVTDNDRNAIRSIVSGHNTSVEFITIADDKMNHAYEVRGITSATYYRLLIPWIIPQHDKICYVDGDTIFKKSISSLYDCDMENKLVAGVRVCDINGRGFKKYVKKIGCCYEEYINAGVLVFNSQMQREKNIKEEYMKQMKKKYTFQDQDILNIVCRGSISYLPISQNTPPSHADCDTTCIIHYVGVKPWNQVTEGWLEWWEVYARSLFYDKKVGQKAITNTLNYEYKPKQLLNIAFKAFFPKTYAFIRDIR